MRRHRRDAIDAHVVKFEWDTASYSDHQHKSDAQHPPRQGGPRRAAAQRPHLRQVGLDRDLEARAEHLRGRVAEVQNRAEISYSGVSPS